MKIKIDRYLKRVKHSLGITLENSNTQNIWEVKNRELLNIKFNVSSTDHKDKGSVSIEYRTKKLN